MSTTAMKPRVTSFAPQFLVDDLERSIGYYKKLGFTFGEPWDGFYAIGHLDGLELHLKEAPKNQDERRHRRDNEHLDAAAGVDGIEAFFTQCVANGATILKPLTPTAWGTKDFYVEDPDGYIICFGGRPMAGNKAMDNLYARSVFFVQDAERSLRFYTEQLGFSEDWNVQEAGRTTVCQVSLFGFELILNQVGDWTQTRAGHGRVFIGLEDDQGEPLRKHILATGIQTQRHQWGRPTLVVKDLDANELFFWLPHDDWTGFEMSAAYAG